MAALCRASQHAFEQQPGGILCALCATKILTGDVAAALERRDSREDEQKTDRFAKLKASVQKLFAAIDNNGDGNITMAEWRVALRRKPKLASIFLGKVAQPQPQPQQPKKLRLGRMNKKNGVHVLRLQKLFKEVDGNDDAALSLDELFAFLASRFE
jgi:hypothetical protein